MLVVNRNEATLRLSFKGAGVPLLAMWTSPFDNYPLQVSAVGTAAPGTKALFSSPLDAFLFLFGGGASLGEGSFLCVN